MLKIICKIPNDQQFKHSVNDQQFKRSTNDQQFKHSSNDQQFKRSMNDQQFKRSMNDQQFTRSANDQQFKRSTNDQQFKHSANNQQFNRSMNDQQFNRSMNDQQCNRSMNDQQFNRSMNEPQTKRPPINQTSKFVLHLIVPVRGQQKLYERFMTNLIKHKQPEWDIHVFVINQVDDGLVRPGWHFNIGILRSFSEGNPRCIITHDVHVLVEEHSIDYTLCSTPTEICVAFKCFQDGLSENRSKVRIMQATPQQ